MKNIIPVLCFLIFVFSVKIFSQDYERIESYHSEIKINTDGSMNVEETIKVYSLGQQIKRGIFRDFPTRYKDDYGNKVIVDFELLETLRDGKTEPNHYENVSNGIRIYLGSENIFLTPRKFYTYTIRYKTSRQLGFFKDHDELYWNVTGNGWAFEIQKATARITLPEGISKDDLKAYAFTGQFGSKGRNYTYKINPDASVEFITKYSLNGYEGLTVVVEFPKGFVKEADTSQKINYFIKDNRSIIIALAGLVILFLYYIFFWFRYGRDPEKQTIIPLYEAPGNITPAAARYLLKMGFDNKCFAALIMNLAVKKHLTIQEDDATYQLIGTGIPAESLSSEEKKVLTSLSLQKKGKSLLLKNVNHSEVKKGINALKSALKTDYEKTYFITNRKYFLIGILISVIVYVATIAFSSEAEIGLFIWLSIWSFGVILLVFTVFKSWVDVFRRGRKKAASIAGAIFITLFSLPFIGGEIFGLVMLSMEGSPFTLLLLALIGTLNVVFYQLLKAPTLLGRSFMDKIEGFKMYLGVAEKDRLNLMHPVDKTPELFEKFLPFAFALGVEQEWSEQFESILSSVREDGRKYSPSFYSGTAWSTFGASGFASSFSGSFSSAVSSSSSAPGSSSGSGGSSGGGGGGGGGGGW
ncbi:MAG: DUF2207 domain-containing protein [Ignavibacteriales bacterium]|nr:MAG: DUF2207 domain-containing protein [Ignavibacteriales bacterium]